MAPARLARLVVGRRAAVSSASTSIISSAPTASRRRRRMAGRADRGCTWEILDAFREAAIQYGIPAVDDFNTGDNEGVSYFHVNQKRGRRWSAARGFLKPVLHRQNLAAGVRLPGRGRRVFRQARAQRRALAAGRALRVGALPRRGGPGGRLDRLAASVDAVGRGPGGAALAARHSRCCSTGPASAQNLHDHLQLRMIFKVSGVKTLNATYASLAGRAAHGPRLCAAPARADDHGAVAARPVHPLRPHAGPRQYPVSRAAAVAPQVRRAAASVPGLHGQRRQYPPDQPRRAHAQVRRPSVPPAIKPNYLATPEDRRVAADSIRVTRAIVAQPALRKYSPVEYLPGAQVRDDDEAALEKAAGDIGTTIFHPVGTAKHGPRRRSARGGRRAAARDRHRGLARRSTPR